MKKCVMVLLLLGNFLITLRAQHVEPSLPPSFSMREKSLISFPGMRFDALDTAMLMAQDREFPEPMRYAVCKPVNIDLLKESLQDTLASGGRIWRYAVSLQGARGIGVNFSHFRIPEGAGIWLYTPSGTRIFGAIDASNNSAVEKLTLGEFQSDSMIIEYFEPALAAFHGELVISSFNQAYRDIFSPSDNNSSTALDNIGTRCPQAYPYWKIKHAVCRITFNDGTNGYLCTGYLINNTSNDGEPYFSTANHCISGVFEAMTLVAYFNYEESKCNVSGSNVSSLSGAKFLYTVKPSDFTLLKLSQQPTAENQPVFAGWDVSDAQVLSASSIHHPAGKPKVLALDNVPISTYPNSINWDNTTVTPANSHWEVKWSAGNTQGGSSGAPIFDQNYRAIGQLHGGSSVADYFGKMSYSFKTDSVNFRKYLDPMGTGKLISDAFIPDTNVGEAFFDTKLQSVCTNAPIMLVNKTVFSADSFQWSVTPNTFSFLDQTTNKSRNPMVEFPVSGTYTVNLNSWTNGTQSSVTRTGYITARNTIFLNTVGVPDAGVLCASKLNQYPIITSGAMDYSYSIQPFSGRLFLDPHKDTLLVTMNKDSLPLGGFTTMLTVTGSHGACVTTIQKILKVGIVLNDDPKTAFPLNQGVNGSFTNSCATTFADEPHPPVGNCYSQLSWCANSQDPTSILQNSVWFHFVAPASGKVNIFLHGFDAQIALYKATSAEDFTKNMGNVHLLAANDDQPNSIEPQITPVKVIPGNEYWLQVDGGKNGLSDTFSIALLPDAVTAYPNPTYGPVEIDAGTRSSENIDLEIFDLSGRNVRSLHLQSLSEGEKFQFDISELPRGIYIIRYQSSYTTAFSKILKL